MNSLLAVFVLLIVFVVGRPEYQSMIPNGKFVERGLWPGVGHLRPEGRGERNAFGEDFENGGFLWENICMLDSDGDGYSNGEELGDVLCEWRVGDDDPDSAGVTHPGFVNDEVPTITTESCLYFSDDESNSVLNVIMNHEVPQETNHYFCRNVDFGSATDLHIVRFDPIVAYEDDYLKEFILYECDPDAVLNSCESVPTGCSFLYSYSWGGSSFCLPDDVGFLVEPENQYFVQARYTNTVNGTYDQSGLNITFSTTLREHNAGILKLGVSYDELVIPAQESAYILSNVCPEVCLNRKLSSSMTDIYVFASRFSGHSFALSMTTESSQDGENKEIIAHVPYYDLNIRETTSELLHSVDGQQQIATHCTYDSSSTTDDILGGHDFISEERCENYVAYYPKIEAFSACRTFINAQINSEYTGIWRDGRNTALCGDDILDVSSGELVEECSESDLEALLTEVETLNSDCSSCDSTTCKNEFSKFVKSACVDAMGFHHVLSRCQDFGIDASICTDFGEKFDTCNGVCAIGVSTHCAEGELCESYECIVQDNRTPTDRADGLIFGVLPLLEFLLIVGGAVVGILIIILFITCACCCK